MEFITMGDMYSNCNEFTDDMEVFRQDTVIEDIIGFKCNDGGVIQFIEPPISTPPTVVIPFMIQK
jgi:hypothetical protein